MKHYAALILCLLTISCSGDDSTTTTSPGTVAGTRVISLSGDLSFGNVTVGSTAVRSFTITNSGTATLTVSSMSAPCGGMFKTSFLTGTVGPKASQAVSVSFTPTAAQDCSGAITVIGDQTSGENRINTAAAGIGVAPPTIATLTGTVRDGTSNGVLPGIQIQITAGVNAGASTQTNSAGNYTLGGLSIGTFTLSAVASGYQTVTQSVTLSGNRSVDIVLPRIASTTPPSGPGNPGTPTPDVEYRITGSARRCGATYENSSGGTNQAEVTIPFSYSWSGAKGGMFLYMSCQIDTGGDTGSIHIALIKRGTTVQTADANGFANIATVSGSF